MAGNDLVKEDDAAQAYVENFALSILNRASRQVEGRVADKKTTETFLAAATFLELLRIFLQPGEELDPEVSPC